MLRSAVAKGIIALQPDASESRGSRHGDALEEPERGSSSRPGETKIDGDHCGTVWSTEADQLFTDLELVEDSRAVDFAVQSYSEHCSHSTSNRCAGAGAAGSAGAAPDTRGSSSRNTAPGGGMRRPKTGHYYDWFLSKLEGQELGIIRGDVDARGKRLPGAGRGLEAAAGCAGGGAVDGRTDALRDFSLGELLDLVRDMIEELDVPDDSLSKDRHTQGGSGVGPAWVRRGLELCPCLLLGRHAATCAVGLDGRGCEE